MLIPRSAVVYIPGSAVIVPYDRTAEVWNQLQDVLKDQRQPLPPLVAALLEDLRRASRECAAERHQRLADLARGSTPAPFTVAAPSFTPSQSITAQEAAAQLGVSQQRITSLARAGRLRGRQDQRGTWHLDPHSIEDYGKARRKQR